MRATGRQVEIQELSTSVRAIGSIQVGPACIWTVPARFKRMVTAACDQSSASIENEVIEVCEVILGD
jgi:hypothetical protein